MKPKINTIARFSDYSKLIPFSLLALLLGFLYLWLRQRYSYWARRGVPHEKPVLVLGNMKGIGRELHWKHIDQRIYERFNLTGAPFVGFYTFLTRTAFLLDLDLIKHVLIKDFGNFAHRGLFHNVRDDPLTGNLLFLDGDQWRKLRHKLSPVFTSGRMRYMFPTMVEVGKSFAIACEELLSSPDAADGADFEAKDLCARFTTDIIGTCAFGIECNSLQDPEAMFRCMGRTVVEEPRHTTLVQAFMFANPSLARKLRMKLFADDVSSFFMTVVQQTVSHREALDLKRNDFMDLLIELKQKRDQLGAGSDMDDLSNGLTLEQVAAQALIFFLAGFETSSTTLSICMYELALNPSVQEKLQEEIRHVLTKCGGELTYESVNKMVYLEQVVAETLRKYSVLPHIVRETVQDYRVPNTDFVIERGTKVIIPVDAIHHDPLLYPEPEKFQPERFSPDECSRRHNSAYLPFGDGPRNCIGMRFGKLQVKIGIIMLLRYYQLTTTPRTQIPLNFSKKFFLISPQGGIHLKLNRLR